MVDVNPSMYSVIFSPSLWKFPKRLMESCNRFRYDSLVSVSPWRMDRRLFMASRMATGVTYARRICCAASFQQVTPPCRQVPPRLVRKLVSAGSNMNVEKAINAFTYHIRSISDAFTKRDNNPKIFMRSLPSKACCFIVKAKF